jgi:hypothetical protein
MHFQERVKKKNALGLFSVAQPPLERDLQAPPQDLATWRSGITSPVGPPIDSISPAKTKKGTVIPSLP